MLAALSGNYFWMDNIYKLFQNLRSASVARRRLMKKRSILGVCEYFEEACNAANGPQMGF